MEEEDRCVLSCAVGSPEFDRLTFSFLPPPPSPSCHHRMSIEKCESALESLRLALLTLTPAFLIDNFSRRRRTEATRERPKAHVLATNRSLVLDTVVLHAAVLVVMADPYAPPSRILHKTTPAIMRSPSGALHTTFSSALHFFVHLHTAST